MEKKVRKKRAQSTVKIQPQTRGTINSTPSSVTHTKPVGSILDIPFNPDTARQAVILSEIIGKPVSKRGRRR